MMRSSRPWNRRPPYKQPCESGIVHQQVGPGCGDHPLQLGQLAGIGQVGDPGPCLHAMLVGQPPARGAQPVAAPGGDGQVLAVDGGQPGAERLSCSG